jgi:hypothetical protein
LPKELADFWGKGKMRRAATLPKAEKLLHRGGLVPPLVEGF